MTSFHLAALILTIFGTTATVALVKRRRCSRLGIFSLIVPLGGWTVLLFGVAPLIQALYDSPEEGVVELRTRGIWYVLTGFTVMALSYGTAVGTRLPGTKLDRPWNRASVLVVTGLFWAVGVAANLWFFQSVGGVQNYVDNLGSRVFLWSKGFGVVRILGAVGQLAVILWFAYMFSAPHRRRAWTDRCIGLVILLSAIVPQLPIGSRTGILRIVVYVVLLFHLLRRPIRWRELLVGGFAAMLFVYAYGELRTNLSKHDMLTVARDVRSSLSEDMVRNLTREYGGYIQTVGVILEGVPDEVPYQYGKSYALGVAYVVPRQLWEDKPAYAAILLTDVLYAGGWLGYSYLTPTLWGEAFMNFGYAGALIVPLAFGAVIGLCNSHLEGRMTAGRAAVFCIVFKWVDGLIMGDFVNTTAPMIPQFALLLAACLFVSLPSGRFIARSGRNVRQRACRLSLESDADRN